MDIGIFGAAPVRLTAAGALLAASCWALWGCGSGWRRAVRAADDADACLLWIIRGLRNLVLGLTGLAWAAGLWFQQGWLGVIGLVVLGQELYEMGFLLWIIRRGPALEGRRPHWAASR